MTATIALTPLDPAGDRYALRLFRNGRRPRREQWEARSADGVWAYHREEDTGTTWTVLHIPTGRFLYCEPSLDWARTRTADGRALAELDRRDAEAARPRCTWRGQWTAVSCSWPAEPGTDRCRDPRHQRPTDASLDRAAPPGLYGGPPVGPPDTPGGAVPIRTIIVDGKEVRAGTAEEVGALCISPDSPTGIPGRTYRWYTKQLPPHRRAPDFIRNAAGDPVRDGPTGARLYDADAVEKWHADRPGSAQAAGRATSPDTLNRTATRLDLLQAATDGQVRRDDQGRWELRGAAPSRRVAQSLAELDKLGVFVRHDDGDVRLSAGGKLLRERWNTE